MKSARVLLSATAGLCSSAAQAWRLLLHQLDVLASALRKLCTALAVLISRWLQERTTYRFDLLARRAVLLSRPPKGLTASARPLLTAMDFGIAPRSAKTSATRPTP